MLLTRPCAPCRFHCPQTGAPLSKLGRIFNIPQPSFQRTKHFGNALQQEDRVLTAVITSCNWAGALVTCEGLQGFIPSSLVGTDLERDPEALRGKEIPVKVWEIKESRGRRTLILRHEGAVPRDTQQDAAFWERAERWRTEGAELSAVITSVNRGGAVVECEGYTGFMPFSCFGTGLGRDAEALRGQEITVKIHEITKSGRRRELVLRHESAQPAVPRNDHKDAAFWERAERWQSEGAVVTAVITGLNKGGAVVECEGYTGFMPFSCFEKELGRDAEALRGKEIAVNVVKIEKAKGGLMVRSSALGAAAAQAFDSLQTDHVVEGTVRAIKPYGAFVDLGCGVTGLLHCSQVSHHSSRPAMDDIFREGEQIRVLVLTVDKELGRVKLSTKQLATPGDMVRDRQLAYDRAEERAERLRREYDELFQNLEIVEVVRGGARRAGGEVKNAERAERPEAEGP